MSNINLAQYRPPISTSFSGRTQGSRVRKILKLDLLDGTSEVVRLTIPKDTTTFNPSFFLGLFFKSIEKLGVARFREKYIFDIESTDPPAVRALKKNVEDGLRNAMNTLENKDAFSVFD